MTQKFIQNRLRAIFLFIIRFYNSKRMIPFRQNMGSSSTRTTLGRMYIKSFVSSIQKDVKGDVLEIGRKVYKDLVWSERIETYQCLDIEEYNDIDIVADIQKMPQVKDSSFDTIICTQVLEHVKNPFLACAELYRVLKPGGVLIITVPFLNNYHMEPHDYWRFTEFGLKNLLGSFKDVKVTNYGDTFHFVMATLGFTPEEMSANFKESIIPVKFPIIVAGIAKKSEIINNH